jgi:CHAT domain-containing protein
LVGLTSAFLFAGAQSVVASLWPVYDRSTSIFMKAFYLGLRDNQPVSEALRAARERVIRATGGDDFNDGSLAAPFLWGAFVAVGDAR